MQYKNIEEACEEIDAGFFSSDAFFDKQSVEDMEVYIGRWQRQIAVIKEANYYEDEGE